jgi:regulatory protein
MTQPQTALEAATAALARRDRSAAGLAAYLEQHGIDPAEAATAVERLEAAGYLDDARFAALRAEALAARGYGDGAIRRELEDQGLDAGRIAAAIETLDSEPERARALLERFGASPRLARRLTAKGFAPESIESALASVRARRDDLER